MNKFIDFVANEEGMYTMSRAYNVMFLTAPHWGETAHDLIGMLIMGGEL